MLRLAARPRALLILLALAMPFEAVAATRFGVIATYGGTPIAPNTLAAMLGTTAQRMQMPVTVFLRNNRTGVKWALGGANVDPADPVLANRHTWIFPATVDFLAGDAVTSPCFTGLTGHVVSSGPLVQGANPVVLDTDCQTYATDNTAQLANWKTTTDAGQGLQWQVENRATQGAYTAAVTASIASNVLTITAYQAAKTLPMVGGTVSDDNSGKHISGTGLITAILSEWNGTSGTYAIEPSRDVLSEAMVISSPPKNAGVLNEQDWVDELEFTYQQVRAQGSPDPILLAFGNEVNSNSDEAASAAQYLTDLTFGCAWAHTHALKCTDSGNTSPGESLAYWCSLYFAARSTCLGTGAGSTLNDAAHLALADVFALVTFPKGSDAAILDDIPNSCAPAAGVLDSVSHPNHIVRQAALTKTIAINAGLASTGIDYVNAHYFQTPPPWAMTAKLEWMKSLAPAHALVFNAAGQYSKSGADVAQMITVMTASGAALIEWFANDGTRAQGLMTAANTLATNGRAYRAAILGAPGLRPLILYAPRFAGCNTSN